MNVHPHHSSPHLLLAAEPGNRAALRRRVDVLGTVLAAANEVNHYEVYRLRHRIEETRSALGDRSASES